MPLPKMAREKQDVARVAGFGDRNESCRHARHAWSPIRNLQRGDEKSALHGESKIHATLAVRLSRVAVGDTTHLILKQRAGAGSWTGVG